VAAAFAIEYFARPASQLVGRLLGKLATNDRSAHTVTREQFESIFILYRYTSSVAACDGLDFYLNYDNMMRQFLVNLIMNGSLQVHSTIVGFTKLNLKGYDDTTVEWWDKSQVFYWPDKLPLLTLLEPMYVEARERLSEMADDMRLKVQGVRMALDLRLQHVAEKKIEITKRE
jgi:hypothetical protein